MKKPKPKLKSKTVKRIEKLASQFVPKKRTAKTTYSSDRPGISPIEWARLSGLKKGWREIDLQHHIAQKLRASGYTLKENVKIDLGGGSWCEADIVIYKDGFPWQVLEVKPSLDRGKVIEGTNQARSYTEHLKCSQQPILIGLAPYSDAAYWGGKNAAKTTAHNRVGIIFLNEDASWTPTKRDAKSKGLGFWERAGIKLAEIPFKVQIPVIAIFALWGILAGWEFSSKVFHPDPPPKSAQATGLSRCSPQRSPRMP